MTHHCRNVLISLNWDAHVAKFQVFCLGGCSLSQQTSFFSESKQVHIWQHPRQYIIGKHQVPNLFCLKKKFSKTCLSEGRQTRATVQCKNLGLDGTWFCKMKLSFFYAIEGSRSMKRSPRKPSRQLLCFNCLSSCLAALLHSHLPPCPFSSKRRSQLLGKNLNFLVEG